MATMVQDRVVAMMKVELLTWVEARVQVCVAAMMTTEQLTRVVAKMLTMISAR